MAAGRITADPAIMAKAPTVQGTRITVSVSSLLAFEPRILRAALPKDVGLSAARVAGALRLLAGSGQVGHNLDVGAFFHRPLPFRPRTMEALNPRLADARKLIGTGVVTFTEPEVALVRSGDTVYEVHLSQAPAEDRRTCRWWFEHRGGRGPCEHVPAARIEAQTSDP
jgi:hypothetical protein